MSLLDPTVRSATGAATEKEVTGRDVAAPTTLLEESWRDFVFAEVWTRPDLPRRARFLVAMASAATCGLADGRIDDFVRGALTTNVIGLAELREAALHLAVYSGWGNGDRLDQAVTRVATALGLPPVDGPPIRSAPWDAQERNDQGHAEFAKVMTFPPGPPSSPYLVGINNFVFGEMWCRRGLDERSRRWITLVGVCESGAEIPIRSHVHAAMASGNCEPQEMLEFVLQYGTHAGWPKASRINSVVLEMIDKVKKGLPWHG
ncbi:carboxymuconolactone decarboxylase family protein [Novosphingobium guangzhouense]|uniref:Gamma-carboxymuconolactone decarboxylase n=1 Tax=Novosphingobium guangzhouense TaxID=1850347 RepID=A0A2K2G5I6_9SPHN|nr:carboxymuconolactone decarboxylase family protein [Novosphingobium guangzhouense]PNU06282.1 gamma-carboxymuconolactone decarboxylase [Novosphingobium guangzhouense]